MKTRQRLTESGFIERLRKKFEAPEWAFFSHVPNSTGGASRTADGVAVNCWPSRGLAIVGFEVKSHRSDFLKELRDPSKSAAIQKYCDHWYMVAEEDCVKDGELPATWGLMIPHAKGLKVVKEAPLLQAVEVDRRFFAALARTVHKETFLPEEIEAKISVAQKEGEQRGKESVQWKLDSEERKSKKLEAIVENFKQQTGLDLEGWTGDKVIEMFKVFNRPDDKDKLFKNLMTAVQGWEQDLEVLKVAVDQLKGFRCNTGSELNCGSAS